MKKELEENQKELLDKVKKKLILNKISSELDIFRYLSNSNKLSFTQLQFNLNKNYLLKYLILCFKNFFSFFIYYDYKLHNPFIKKKYNEVIISWGKIGDFDNQGNFFDRYCGKNSLEKKKILWIVQYEDLLLPKKISQNVILFKRSHKRSFQFKNFLFLFTKSQRKIFSIKNFSPNSLYALIFYNKVGAILKNVSMKKLIIPYEGQLFQKFIIKKFREKGIKIIGIVHTFLQPIPLNLFFEKAVCPDELHVNSVSMKNCLVKHMNWKKNNILIKKSTRFFRKNKIDMKKKLFFPYEIPNPKKLERVFISFVELYKNKINLNLDVKIHPIKLKNKSHLNLKKKILDILRKNRKYNKKINKNVSIFFEYTSSIIEALERGIKVIQICTEPTLQVYTPYIYKGISIKQINKNMFEYKKIKKNSLIKM